MPSPVSRLPVRKAERAPCAQDQPEGTAPLPSSRPRAGRKRRRADPVWDHVLPTAPYCRTGGRLPAYVRCAGFGLSGAGGPLGMLSGNTLELAAHTLAEGFRATSATLRPDSPGPGPCDGTRVDDCGA
jgi:hypothetical protein